MHHIYGLFVCFQDEEPFKNTMKSLATVCYPITCLCQFLSSHLPSSILFLHSPSGELWDKLILQQILVCSSQTTIVLCHIFTYMYCKTSTRDLILVSLQVMDIFKIIYPKKFNFTPLTVAINFQVHEIKSPRNQSVLQYFARCCDLDRTAV